MSQKPTGPAESRLYRRRYLGLLGAGLTLSLAGCSSGSTESGDGAGSGGSGSEDGASTGSGGGSGDGAGSGGSGGSGSGDGTSSGGGSADCSLASGMEAVPADIATTEARLPYTFDIPAGWEVFLTMRDTVSVAPPDYEGKLPNYTIDVRRRDQPAEEDEIEQTLASDSSWSDAGTITFDGESRQVITKGSTTGGPHVFSVVLPEHDGSNTYWNWMDVHAGANTDPPCHATMRSLATEVVGSFRPA